MPSRRWRPGAEAYLRQLPVFVAEADRLVGMIETDNAAEKTTMLRLSQISLIVLACVGNLTMVYLLYLWIIAVMRLQDGVERMTARVPCAAAGRVERQFGWRLARGFNRMAEELESPYPRPRIPGGAKTEQLGEPRTASWRPLYGMAAFPPTSPTASRRCTRASEPAVGQKFDADGAASMVDPSGDKLILDGVQAAVRAVRESTRMRVRTACAGPPCPAAPSSSTTSARPRQPAPHQCEAELQHRHRPDPLDQAGHERWSSAFRRARRLAPDQQLLEAEGATWAPPGEKRRLAAERGPAGPWRASASWWRRPPHDSPGAGTSRTLQVQLQDALRRQDQAEIEEIVPAARRGRRGGYQDVRELLTNFRSKLERGEPMPAIEQTVERFRRQTGLPVHLEIEDEGGPLPPEQQLEMLFILQEALSNIRKKHAADQRSPRQRAQPARLPAGVGRRPGFEAGRQPGEPNSTSGLKIMAERWRGPGPPHVEAAPGKGVCRDRRTRRTGKGLVA